jgi:glycosidase
MKKITLTLLFGIFSIVALAQRYTPEWVKNATIYEVNVRQFSPEGTFAGVQAQLPRLKEMGVDIIWLMPIHPIGELNRKGSLGSYYAVRDYRDVNPEFGSIEEFGEMVRTAHDLGMKVILDWVANHTSPDHVWLEQGHKDWYTLDATGNVQPTIGTDWTDVADLNFDNKDMRQEMINCMASWVRDYDVDGYRCDVAGWVPMDFWTEARTTLDQIKPVFMLAEAEGNELYQAFEMTYGWELHHIMNDIAKGKKDAGAVHEFFAKPTLPNNGFQMNFTSNHDENSWNGTEMERLGEARLCFAVFAATIDGMPLVYNGQETSLDRRLKFFEKDPIVWRKMDLVPFYQTMLNLHQTHPALIVGKGQTKPRFLTAKSDKNTLAYVREAGDRKVVVVLNLSAKEQIVTLKDPSIAGKYQNLFSGQSANLKANHQEKLAPWGYVVYVR